MPAYLHIQTPFTGRRGEDNGRKINPQILFFQYLQVKASKGRILYKEGFLLSFSVIPNLYV